jgi:hypothetical protein
MPWRLSPEKNAVTEASEEKADSSSGNPGGGERVSDSTDARLRFLAGELSPLLDRLGRVLTDFAPHLRTYSDSPARSGGGGGSEESKEQELSSVSNSPAGATAATTAGMQADPIPRDALEVLTSLLRSRRAPSPPAHLAYRQNVSTSTARTGLVGTSGNAGHLDIHIHAILTPLNRQQGTTADNSENTSVASGAASMQSSMHQLQLNSAVNEILIQNAREQQMQQQQQQQLLQQQQQQQQRAQQDEQDLRHHGLEKYYYSSIYTTCRAHFIYFYIFHRR